MRVSAVTAAAVIAALVPPASGQTGSTTAVYAGSDLGIPFNAGASWGTTPYCTAVAARCCCATNADNSVLGATTTACTDVDKLLCSIRQMGLNATSYNAAQQTSAQTPGNQIWVIIAGTLVFFMQCGFAMLEVGSVRRKNTQNIIFKNLIDACIAAIGFYFLGYGFAYGDPANAAGSSSNQWIGTDNFMLYKEADDESGQHSFFFQFAFAATAATIVSGAVAERTSLAAYFCYSVFITAFVYPVVVHWVWSGNGWLSAFAARPSRLGPNGMFDYAGSGVVHAVGGWAGLMGTFFLGPRNKRFDPNQSPSAWQGQSTVLCALGTLILWFGWYGFNCGSTLAMDGENAGKVATTTTLAAAAGGLTTTFLSRVHLEHWAVSHTMNGVLAGLVSITAPCSIVDEWCAVIIGIIGGIVYYVSALLLVRAEIDDPLNAFPVHGACGVWGCLSVGVFAQARNVERAYGGEPTYDMTAVARGHQFGVQLAGIVSIVVWTCVTTGFLFFLLNKCKLLRVKGSHEDHGLDRSEHGDIHIEKRAPPSEEVLDTLLQGPPKDAPKNTAPDVESK